MFSKLKDGLGYDRFRHRGMKRIGSDLTLMSIGINLNKHHSKLIKGQAGVIEYKRTACFLSHPNLEKAYLSALKIKYPSVGHHQLT